MVSLMVVTGFLQHVGRGTVEGAILEAMPSGLCQSADLHQHAHGDLPGACLLLGIVGVISLTRLNQAMDHPAFALCLFIQAQEKCGERIRISLVLQDRGYPVFSSLDRCLLTPDDDAMMHSEIQQSRMRRL